MEEKFKVGNILEDTITKERFKVLEVSGSFPYAFVDMLHLDLGLRFGNFANNLTELVLIKQIKFEYQVKKPIHLFDSDTRERFEVKELIYPCDPNKSDRENLDDAFCKACELGAEPNKEVRWKFIEE